MTNERAELALERLLAAIERELLAASDDDVLAAARELGIKPDAKRSGAFIGVTMFARPRAHSALAARGEASSAERRPRRRPKRDSPSS